MHEESLHGVTLVHVNMTAQRFEGKRFYASRGYRIYCSDDEGLTWDEDGHFPAPLWRRVVVSHSLLRRMSRSGIYGVLPLADGSRLCVAAKSLLRADAGSSVYHAVFSFKRGSRPLNLCLTPDGKIYWGEYFLNLTRSSPVRIFCSDNQGKHWETAFTFPKGSICHVHRVVHDPFDDAVLVCTGDRDHEVAILKTTDGFKTLTPLVQGKQEFRTTSLIPLQQCILYGSDNPKGVNYVMSLDRGSKDVRIIQKLPGPVLFGCRIGNCAVFATMIEKEDHEVSLWAGDAAGFRQVVRFRSQKMNQFWREIIGYSTVILPEGIGDWPELLCTPVGTREYPECLLKIDLDKAGVKLYAPEFPGDNAQTTIERTL